MIKTINGGKGIIVTNNFNSDPYISPGSAGAGMIRWNPNMNCIEVNDGSVWKQFNWSHPMIELSEEVLDTLEWAKQKKVKEAEIEALANEYPVVAELKDKLDIMLQLVKDHRK